MYDLTQWWKISCNLCSCRFAFAIALVHFEHRLKPTIISLIPLTITGSVLNISMALMVLSEGPNVVSSGIVLV